jgi:reactive intermediate/imine deaminase
MAEWSKRAIVPGPPPAGPYSPAVEAGGLIYVSGTLARDGSGAIAGRGDVAAQTTHIMERIAGILAAAGSSLDRAVAATVYLRSAADFEAMNRAYAAFWRLDPPTRTTVIAELPAPDALVEISMIAVPADGERLVVHPPSWQRSPSPYSYAIRTGDTVFLSGLVSRNGRDNTVVDGDVRAQTRVVMENAREILEAAGLGFEHVVSGRVYLPDAADFEGMNEVYRSCFPRVRPVRATVKAGLAGPRYLVEMTFVASTVMPEVVETGDASNPNLSAAIRAGSRVYLSGLLGVTPDNTGDVAAQTRETLARAGAALEAAGCTPAQVVDSLVYLTDMALYAPMNDAYRQFFGRDLPARTTVGAGLFAPGGLVEIMLTACG